MRCLVRMRHCVERWKGGRPVPSQRILDAIAKVTARRPKIVLDHILQHGSVSTDELKTLYGYDHPPRAARDVRELGIPLKTVMRAGSNGRRMAHYMLDDDEDLITGRSRGRRAFPKALKLALVARQGEQCAICGTPYPARALQIDHRVPYEVAGDPEGELDPHDFMLICGSCNRSKSFSCEHCDNWRDIKSRAICESCYWGSPEEYTHIAMEQRRRATINWTGDDEVAQYDALSAEAHNLGQEMDEYLKNLITRHDEPE